MIPIIDSLTTWIETILTNLMSVYSIWAYLFVFLIIFVETGIVIAPLLPGDSILFVIGTLLSGKNITVFFIFAMLSLAAIVGDSLNYFIGKHFGEKIIEKKWVNIKYIKQSENFYKKYGKKAIFYARFAPILRTIAPFVAGIGKMNYKEFFMANVAGGVCWVFIFLFAGYLFGNIPVVSNNLSLFILGIIVLSILIPWISYLKNK